VSNSGLKQSRSRRHSPPKSESVHLSQISSPNKEAALVHLQHTSGNRAIGQFIQSKLTTGRPLEAKLQKDMESRFRHDFSEVRVHTDAIAAESARSVSARAYTIGRDVVFGKNEYAPASREGRELLAHELAHTIQQKTSSGAPPSSDPNGIIESSAEGAGREVANGGTVAHPLPACGVGVARAPANYPDIEPMKPTDPTPVSSEQQLSADDSIWLLESLRRASPQDFVRILAANEAQIYPMLQPYGFRGSWVKDQGYLDDFDAAIAKWKKAKPYIPKFGNISRTVSQEKPKSREERKYEDAKVLVRNMNRHGYTRGQVNEALESYDLLDDLVKHGFEKYGRWSFKHHVEYKYEAIAALNNYIDRYDAAHGNKPHPSIGEPPEGENVEFYRAWLEGLGYVTRSFFAAAAANTASKFTNDPKKITAAAGAGAAFEGAVSSVAGAFGAGGTYRPDVVGPRDRPLAVGPWRYTGKQPYKPSLPASSSTEIPRIPRPIDVTKSSQFPTSEPIKLPEPPPPRSRVKSSAKAPAQQQAPPAKTPLVPKAKRTSSKPTQSKAQNELQKQAKYNDNLDKRIARVSNELSEAKQRTVEYKAARLAAGEKQKGGPFKGIWNKEEELYVLERAKAYPDRTILEQVELVGVKGKDGKIKPSAEIAGEGRTVDFLEIDATKVLGGEVKSKAELVHSVEGLKEPGTQGGFKPTTSKVGQQRGKEELIINFANAQGGTLIFKGKDVRTGQDVTVEVDTKAYQSTVVAYDQIRPN
jgi:hypothetical protein